MAATVKSNRGMAFTPTIRIGCGLAPTTRTETERFHLARDCVSPRSARAHGLRLLAEPNGRAPARANLGAALEGPLQGQQGRILAEAGGSFPKPGRDKTQTSSSGQTGRRVWR